ncbi:MAG TPA: signal peptidase II [Acidobacteriaceae bacterium]|jgi:signal peptidase II|nr:signal peptidase II [Acidobacteriaceae bacterium]
MTPDNAASNPDAGQTVTAPPLRDHRPWLLLIALAVFALDRLTKWLVVAHIEIDTAVTVIPRVFRISHVENNGAAFSMFDNARSPERVRWMLLGFSLFAALVVLGFLWKLGRRITPTTVSLALILGGALGNAFDRWRYGVVIDFLEVHIVHYHWPDFNIADSAIVIGGILLCLDGLRAP